ncbi:MAG: BrnA antitoxin family protein [Clostridiales Family XIII bacterium]|nr:BrnA antitoxin family protein [Clostridiales Family XIII bacterium]
MADAKEDIDEMLEEYDFSKAVKNPYLIKARRQITIRIDGETIDYFKRMATETNISYQNLINLYLADCVKTAKKIDITWK